MNPNVEVIQTQQEWAGVKLARTIVDELKKGNKVIWFVSGGSSIPIARDAAKTIDPDYFENLHVLMVDEKFTDKDQAITNWSQLTEPETVISTIARPILGKGPVEESLSVFRDVITTELEWADFVIGQFGIGDGFHTGGIESKSEAITETELAVYYQKGEFQHITVTTKLISLLDVAFINSFSASKEALVKHFLQSDASVNDEPTQSLKAAKKTHLITDIDV